MITDAKASVVGSPLQSGHALCLKRREPAATRGSLQECSSIGRAPVSKTGGRRFEPCHSCQDIKDLQVYNVKLRPAVHSLVHSSGK